MQVPQQKGIMLKTTREQLEKLTVLEAAATPGPWGVETVRTQVGLCHKVGGGWPRRELISGTREQYACIYEDGGDPRNPGKELHANAQVFAESRNALAALLHDAAVAHRLVAGMHAVMDALADMHIRTNREEYRHAYLELEALLSEAKGAE